LLVVVRLVVPEQLERVERREAASAEEDRSQVG